MKSPRLMLLVAVSLIGLTDLHAQVITSDVPGEVTEFTHANPSQQQPQVDCKTDALDQRNSQPATSATPTNLPVGIAISENTILPGSEANVPQQSMQTGATELINVDGIKSSETAKRNSVSLTPKQIRAKKRLAKANQEAAKQQAQKEAAMASAFVPKNSVYNDSKISLYGQVGIDDQKLSGLNLILATRDYPTTGSYAYRAEIGSLLQVSEQNSLDIGLRYGLMNGLSKSQRIERQNINHVTESKSTMWLLGTQIGIDHNLLNDTEWRVCVGLGAGVEVGGLQLTERVRESMPTVSTEPAIPAPDEVAVINYTIVNFSVTPRLSVRSPELANGWQFQARVGYQFGENTLLRGDQNTTLRDDLIYNPSGMTASAGIIFPLPKILKKRS